MAQIFDALLALPRGAAVVLANRQVRRKALVPAFIALFVSLLLFAISTFSFSSLVDVFGLSISSQGLFWGSFSQVLLAAGLLVLVPIVGLLLIITLSAYYQVEIARETFRHNGISAHEKSLPFLQDVIQSSSYEARRMIAVLPLIALAFVLNFIPPLVPVAILLGGWILGREFVDIALEARGIPYGERAEIFRSSRLGTAFFGLTLGVLAAVPLGLIVLSPVAAAGAVQFVSRFEQIRKTSA